MSSLSHSTEEFALDIACLKEKNNFLAVRKGMPAIGSTLKNAHGIEWVVDGHTGAPTLLRSGEGDQEELYPAIIPQNLSKRLTEFAAEIDRCTPKVLVPLDTMPTKFPKRGHPGGHWVDAWSDPYRILLFLDAASIHETVLAHELAHVWIDLVRGIEDYRVLKDKSNSARYAHVQFIQSFVLDIPVNRVLDEKGFDIEVIQRDAGIALKNLAESAARGYAPPSKREAAFLGSFLATSILAAEEHSAGIVRYEDNLLLLKPVLPEVYALGERLASVIAENPPNSRENVRAAVDAALSASFSFCDEELDIEGELIEIAPEICWDEDKHPHWFAGLSPRAKCEIGVAKARLGASSTARYELSYASNSRVRIRFEHDDGGFTDYVELQHVTLLPGDVHPHIKLAIDQSERNTRRIEEMMNQGKLSPIQNSRQPAFRNLPPPCPGQRNYSTGLAQWITQVRLEEQLQGEHPYAYANCNPINYVDPDGLYAIKSISCAGCGPTKIITVEPGDITGIIMGGRNTTGRGGFGLAPPWANARHCVLVNGGYFQGNKPMGPVTSCTGTHSGGVGNPPQPIPITTGHGSITGSGRPVGTVPSGGSPGTGRTGACVNSNGRLVGVIVTQHGSAQSFLNCGAANCPPGSSFVWLDGSGSSQIWGRSPGGRVGPILGGWQTGHGKPDWRPVNNWILVCD